MVLGEEALILGEEGKAQVVQSLLNKVLKDIGLSYMVLCMIRFIY